MPKTESKMEIAGVEISHPNKIMFPEAKITKAMLAEYYAAVGPLMLPELAKRPLSLLRCPSGRRSCFVQKHPGGSGYREIPQIRIRERESGEAATYLYVSEVRHLILAVQQNCIELHPWSCRAPRIERPDRLIFDLDPGPGVGTGAIVELALAMREILRSLELESFVRVSGGKGLHIVVPIEARLGWDKTYAWSRSFAELICQEHSIATLELGKAKRKGRIFVDYLRNNRGSTAVASFSVRARERAPVAMPIAWQDLDSRMRFDGFVLQRVLREISGRWKDPWKGIDSLDQSLPGLPARKGRGKAHP